MSIKPDKEVLEAIKKEGILSKQGRSVLQKYFQRYWKIIDEGLTLGYAQDKQSFEQGRLSGKIALKDILSIVDEEKPKKFQLVCEGRVYKLEAETPKEKKAWIEALQTCMKYAIKYSQEEKKDLLAIDDDIIFEESEDIDEKQTERWNLLFLQPIGFVANTAKTLVVDTALTNVVKLGKAGVNAVGDIIRQEKIITNDDFLTKKKLKDQLANIDPDILKSRIIMGFLYKETKEIFGVGKVDELINDIGIKDSLTKQWFLMVSSKPILFDDVDRDDEEVLDAGRLPFEIDPEILYAYNENCDDSAPVQTIPMGDVAEVIVKKKANRELFYRFVLNLGKKKIHLITHDRFDMTRWVKAIQASRAVVKEQAKSKLPVVRNIYWLKRILDEQGEDDLVEKLEMDYDRMVGKIEANKYEGVKGLLTIQKVVADELIAVINSCLVQKNQRIDIIKFYMDCFHEKIVLSFRNYFKRNEKTLDNKDCFEMINFLVWYRDLIRVFGDAFYDKRIHEGILSLCALVSRRLLRGNLEANQNIIKQEISTEPRLDTKNRLATNGPQDIFRIVNESFQVNSYCNCQEFILSMLDIEKNTLMNYQEGLKYIIENCKVSTNQLAAYCNNTVTYISSVKGFIHEAEKLNTVTAEQIALCFDEGTINKGFANVSRKAYESMAEEQFSRLAEEWRNIYFLDVDLRLSTLPGLKSIQAVMDKIHSNYTGKVDLACLEKIVTCYIQTFTRNADQKRLKKEDSQRISTKLHEDEIFLRELFSKNLKPSVIENATASIISLHDFLNTNYAFLSMSVKTIKEIYGNSVKWSTLESLIRIRQDELEAEESEEMLKSCAEVYRLTEKSESKGKVFNPFSVTSGAREDDDGDDDMGDSMYDSNGGNNTVLSKEKLVKATEPKKAAVGQNLEGYLQAEKDEFFSDVGGMIMSDLKFENRYFTIRRDMIYYYKAKNSRKAIGSYNLKEATECAAVTGDAVAFNMNMKNKDGEIVVKTFKAENTEKRDKWVEAINKARMLDPNSFLEVSAVDTEFFKDNKPLFPEVEKMPNLRFESPRRLIKKEVVRSNTLEDKQKTEVKKEGCCGALCRIFGIGQSKPKNNGDYMEIKDKEVL